MKRQINHLVHRFSLQMEFMKRTNSSISEAGSRSNRDLLPLYTRLLDAGANDEHAKSIAFAYDRQPPMGTLSIERMLIQIVAKGSISYDELLSLVIYCPWMLKEPNKIKQSNALGIKSMSEFIDHLHK